MTISELKKEIVELKISKDLYSIMIGGLPNEKLCITKSDKWQVYYSERGHMTGLKEFETEAEACEYFLKKNQKICEQIKKVIGKSQKKALK